MAYQSGRRGRQQPPPDIANIGAGLAADVAVAGLRYAENERQAKTGRPSGLDEVLQDLEAHRGIGMGLDQQDPIFNAEKVDGYPPNPTKGQKLYNAILSDIIKEVNARIAAKESQEKKTRADEINIPEQLVYFAEVDWRIRFSYVFIGLGVMVAGWELAKFAIKRDLACSNLNGEPGLSSCHSARELVRRALVSTGGVDCGSYTCAAPWIPAPGASFCTSCNCGSVCERCHSCLCTVDAGLAEERQQCFAPIEYPTHIEWISYLLWSICGVFVLIVMTKAIVGIVVRSLLPTADSLQEKQLAGSATDVTMKDLLKLKKDLMLARLGGDAWKQAEPNRAFIRRMRSVLDTADFHRLLAAGGGRWRGHRREEVVEMLEPGQAAWLDEQPGSPQTDPTVVEISDGGYGADGGDVQHPLRHAEHRPAAAADATAEARGIQPLPPKQDVFDPTVRAWLDDNERKMVDDVAEFYDTVQSAYGKVPTRVELYTSLVEGQPPATSLVRRQIDELIVLLDAHPRRDMPCTLQEFTNEWMEVLKEVFKLDFWEGSQSDETGDDPGKQGFRNDPNVKNVLHMVRILSNPDGESEVSSSTTESFSQDDEGEGANTLRVMSKHLPYLIALARGIPPPTKAQALQQRQAILAATQGLHALATGGLHDDDEGSENDRTSGDSDVATDDAQPLL